MSDGQAADMERELRDYIGRQIVGVANAHAPPISRDAARQAVRAGFDVMMVLTGFIIRFAPLGVLGLVTELLAAL